MEPIYFFTSFRGTNFTIEKIDFCSPKKLCSWQSKCILVTAAFGHRQSCFWYQ